MARATATSAAVITPFGPVPVSRSRSVLVSPASRRASGEADLYLRLPRAGYREKIWDHAGGVLVAQAVPLFFGAAPEDWFALIEDPLPYSVLADGTSANIFSELKPTSRRLLNVYSSYARISKTRAVGAPLVARTVSRSFFAASGSNRWTRRRWKLPVSLTNTIQSCPS